LKSELAPDSVAVVLSAISEEWQTLLEQELLNLLLTRNFLPVVYAPRQNYSIQEQRTHLRRMIEKSDRLLGVIMIAIHPESRREELRQFCADFGKPVIFVDNPPFEISDSYPVNTTFVGFSSSLGGQIAARAVLDSFIRPASHILVIASNTQTKRQEEFKRVIVDAWSNCDVCVDESGMFDEAESYRAVTLHLQKTIKSGVKIDAIFCTSDSMMLGCLRAIEQFSDIKRFQCPRLFSYDGTPAIQRLSESQKSHVARVVVQSPSAVAVAAIDCLESFLAQKQVSSPQWLTPSLFPSVENVPK